MRMISQVIGSGVGFGKENQRMKITQTILKTLAKLIRDNSNGDQVQTQGKVIVVMEHKQYQKAAWIGKKGRWE